MGGVVCLEFEGLAEDGWLRRPGRLPGLRGARCEGRGAVAPRAVLAVAVPVPGTGRLRRVHRGRRLRGRDGRRYRGTGRGRRVVQRARREHGPAAEHGEHGDQHPGRGHEGGGPAAGHQRVHRDREPGPGERLGPLRDLSPLPGCVGRGVREQAERLMLQALRQDGLRQHAEQGHRSSPGAAGARRRSRRCRCAAGPACAARRTVPRPSPRIQDSSWHEPAPERATMSAPSAVSNRARARVVRACAWLRGTPSASARSAPYNSCRRLSSTTSRSPGSSPASADDTISRCWACTRASPRSAVASPAPNSSLVSATAAPSPCSRRRHSFRATAYSQGRSRLGSRSSGSFTSATTKVSRTAPAASAGSLSSDRQYPYNAGAN